MQQQLADARHERREQAASRARSLAAFYGSGGLLNVASCSIPGWHPQLRIGLLAIAVVALIMAGGLALAGSRTHDRVCHLLLGVGSVLIAGCMLSAGRSPMAVAYAFFFCWVSVYAANWWRMRALATHLVIAAACEATALVIVGLHGLVAPACLVSMGACVAAGLVVYRLRGQVRELAIRDPLTGALNRRGLSEVLLRAPSGHLNRTIVALDLDGFKAYNDSRGHAQGDQALRGCVTAWTSLLGRGEVCARLGGDEFVLVCHRSADAVLRLVTQVRSATPAPLSVSAGAATANPDESIADVFARADAALYLDKHLPASGTSAARPPIEPAPGRHPSPVQVRSV
jgi:diguanylate cyclase (GGDEF)-like protein